MIDTTTICHNFKYHAPNSEKAAKYEAIRMIARLFALHLADVCPQSRELSLAMTNLEQAVMWANAAIARDV